MAHCQFLYYLKHKLKELHSKKITFKFANTLLGRQNQFNSQ